MAKRDSERTKMVIGQGALKSFVKKGYARTTMDDIVRESGVSKGGIYWHFKGKEEIFLYLLQGLMERIHTDFQDVQSLELHSEEKIRYFAKRLFHHPEIPLIVMMTQFWTSHFSNRELLLKVKLTYGGLQEMFRKLLFDGMVEGEFETLDIEELTISFLGMIEGIVSYQMIMERNTSSNQIMTTGLNVFLKGIRKTRKEEPSC